VVSRRPIFFGGFCVGWADVAASLEDAPFVCYAHIPKIRMMMTADELPNADIGFLKLERDMGHVSPEGYYEPVLKLHRAGLRMFVEIDCPEIQRTTLLDAIRDEFLR
jgi:hypothetical protein